MRKCIFLMVSVLCTAILAGQTPWSYVKQATDVWPGANTKDMLVEPDGIVSCGDFGLIDIYEGEIYLAKNDISGALLWEQTYDKPGTIEIVQRLNEVPSDGGYLISSILAEGYRPYVIKVDASGNLIWNSAAWSDALPENSAAQVFSYQLASGDIAIVVADDVFKTLHVYTVSNADGSLISSADKLYTDFVYSDFITANIADIITDGSDNIVMIGRFVRPDSNTVALMRINPSLTSSLVHNVDCCGDGFPSHVIKNASGRYTISETELSGGFFGDQYTCRIIDADLSGTWLTGYEVPGAMYSSNAGDLVQTASGDYLMVRFNYSGTAWGYDPADNVEVIKIDGVSLTEIPGYSTPFYFAPYNTIETIAPFNTTGYIAGGSEWSIGIPSYYSLVATDAAAVLPECIFNCVWPGDADNTGVVDMDDLLSVGLGFGSTGAARTGINNDWYAHLSATDWTDALPDGTNEKYTDCDGNGTINADDTLAITLNYSFTHPVNTLRTTEDDVPLYYFPTDLIHIGENSIPIYLGDDATPVDAIYGLRFTAYAEGPDIDATSVHVTFTDSWIDATDNMLQLSKNNGTDIQADAGCVKTDKANSSGSGQIGTLSFVVLDNIAGKNESSDYYLGFNNVRAIDVNSNELTIGANGIIVSSTLQTENSIPVSCSVFPNPVKGNMIHVNTSETILGKSISDITGKIVYSDQSGNADIILPELSNGQYVLEVTTSSGSQNLKLMMIR